MGNNRCRDCYNFSESLGVCKFDWTRGGNTDICDKFLPSTPEEGVKYDKGKPRLGEMVQDFANQLADICKVWEFGANKYSKSNWKLVDNGFERYTNAMVRHFLQEEIEQYDCETNIHHAIHVAWNAIARLYFLVDSPVEDDEPFIEE